MSVSVVGGPIFIAGGNYGKREYISFSVWNICKFFWHKCQSRILRTTPNSNRVDMRSVIIYLGAMVNDRRIVVRICSKIIFHLSELWKAHSFILCDVYDVHDCDISGVVAVEIHH